VNGTVRSNNPGFDLRLGLVPGIPLATGFRPVFHPILILDPIDQVTSFHQPASLIETQIHVVQENRGFGVFSRLYGLSKPLKNGHVRTERRPAPHIPSACWQSSEKENNP
jgi:hypothetical protein